ncbi:MAG TPA: Hsp70 family protein, partial [Acidimicrobiales bacterium]
DVRAGHRPRHHVRRSCSVTRPTPPSAAATPVDASAGVTPADLNAVVLAGGSSRIPLVAEMVRAESGRLVALDAHPEHTVALGAACGPLTSFAEVCETAARSCESYHAAAAATRATT